MIILALETSCDETAAAIIEKKGGKNNFKFKILANIVFSQIKNHRQYGGVVPNLAATLHLKNILSCLDRAFKKAEILPSEIDLIAVTVGPGLIPALLVGVNTAKTLSWLWQKPLIGINHVEAHLLVNWLNLKSVAHLTKEKENIFPAIGLIVSGGHTQLVLIKDFARYQLLGETRDDAAGEAFDKIARLLDLGYPGGPAIEKTAGKRSGKNKKETVSLPRPMIKSADFDFSFSGLKTAVSLLTKEKKLNEKEKIEVAFSAQKAVIDILVSKTFRAAEIYKPRVIILAGGVVANGALRKEFKKVSASKKIKLAIPQINHCTDNAVMVGVSAGLQWKKGEKNLWQNITAQANKRFV